MRIRARDDRNGQSEEMREARTEMNRDQTASTDQPSPSSEGGRIAADEEDASGDDLDATCCARIGWCCCCLGRVIVARPVLPCYRGFRVTWGTMFWLGTCAATILLAWALLYFVFGDTAAPGGALFGFGFLVTFAYSLGWGLVLVPYLHLPPVFGMLLAGIIFRNADLYDIRENLGPATMATMRGFCLTFILLRAGIQLNTTPLRRHPCFLVILAIVPSTLEALVVALCSKGFLDYPWDWAFVTGSILACMSPVVTVNCVLALADEGYGEDKEIPGLICAAASIDSVHVASLFAIAFSMTFENPSLDTEWWSYFPKGFRDLACGILTGTILGSIFVFLPHRSYKYATVHRVVNLCLGALCCTFGPPVFLPGSSGGGGYLAVVLMGFIACTGWKLLVKNFDVRPLRNVARLIWHLAQPILVGVIGADVSLSDWNLTRFGLHVACILCGLVVRLGCAMLATTRMPFTNNERIFVALSWLPKGTAQAAFAPIAYQRAVGRNETRDIEIARDVVALSVVAIVILAPTGAMLVMIAGRYLLNKVTREVLEERRHESLKTLRVNMRLAAISPSRNP